MLVSVTLAATLGEHFIQPDRPTERPTDGRDGTQADESEVHRSRALLDSTHSVDRPRAAWRLDGGRVTAGRRQFHAKSVSADRCYRRCVLNSVIRRFLTYKFRF